MTRVLVVDDEPQILRALSTNLKARGFDVDLAPTGEDALRLAADKRPDVVILDLGLPGIDGIEVVAGLRGWTTVPIIVLSVRDAEADKVAALDAGADDYVTKPFNTLELKARVRALLRRTATRGASQGTTIKCGELTMDLAARSLTLAGKLLHVTPTEWELLRVLMTNAGKTMTHRQLFSAVWPGKSAGDAQQYLRVHVANVRRKIEANPIEPRYIFTEPGVGYRFASCE